MLSLNQGPFPEIVTEWLSRLLGQDETGLIGKCDASMRTLDFPQMRHMRRTCLLLSSLRVRQTRHFHLNLDLSIQNGSVNGQQF